MKYIPYILWQCTWGLPQTLVGLMIYLKNIKCKHYFYHGAVATEWKDPHHGVSLGLFIFVPKEPQKDTIKKQAHKRLVAHEYGHTIQSLLLGPLYLLVIGLPSFTWCMLPYFRKLRKEKKIPYSALYTEKWADYCGRELAN